MYLILIGTEVAR